MRQTDETVCLILYLYKYILQETGPLLIRLLERFA